MSEPAVARVEYADYLALEERAEIKHEYLDGVVRAMAGGTIEHAGLAASMTYLVSRALEGRACRVFSADGKVRIDSANRTTYPDLSIVCGRLERSKDDTEAITNPVVLIEILSPTTEAYDRGEKFRYFRRLASLREYVLVRQDEPLVEVQRAKRKVTSEGSAASLRRGSRRRCETRSGARSTKKHSVASGGGRVAPGRARPRRSRRAGVGRCHNLG